MARDDPDLDDRERDRERRRQRRNSHRDDTGDERDRRRRSHHRDSAAPVDETAAERRHRRGHRATDSSGALLPRAARPGQNTDTELDSPSPRKRRASQSQSTPRKSRTESASRSRSSAPLSLDAIAKLDKANAKRASGWGGVRDYDYDEEYLQEVRKKEERLEKERRREERREKREKERRTEKDRLRTVEVEEKKKKKERIRQAEAESKRRAYESDIAADEDSRIQREKKKKEARDRRRGHTDDERDERKKRYAEKFTPSVIAEKRVRAKQRRQEKTLQSEEKKRRVISGPLLEEGGYSEDYEYQYMMEKRGGAGSIPSDYSEEELARRKKIKRILIGVVSVLIILAIIIPVAVLVSKKNGNSSSSDNTAKESGSSKPKNSNLDGLSENDIPASAKGGILDPFTWYDTTDLNVTYTDAMVGGLSLMGLNSTWDDDVQANDKVPNLKKSFGYGKLPIRGVNVGGWLNMEPFITPSFFDSYGSRDGVIDEWTLCTKLGTAKCKSQFEQHYATFVTKQTFVDIRAAGFDHVRIPFGYWAVTTYDGDVYVPKIAWRYLLRGIEYARQNGLRINLDLHGLPGSQNGWNHSGRQGVIGWLNGTNGELNAQRSLDIHHQLSQFFAQPRYKNIVTLYGLVNEPRMVDLDTQAVLSWTQKAITQIRKDGITAILVFGDGFLGLDNWQGKLQTDDNLLLDVHQYVTFNVDQLSLTHTDKLNFACRGWTQQSKRSMDKTTGFGPTMCGEWSQADTDCTPNINNVGIGTRWEGTMNTGNASTSILKPQCPLKDNTCSCEKATADPSTYSDAYKKWLYQFAVAQMISFEAGWGWFYWTWETEKATQWSWKSGMKAGILPQKVWEREFDCPMLLEDFEALGLEENY
ncbi:glycoside hydrolase family 5 protein [Amniculicola lignicola CBS 123094]|uniref:glucan 1,3-beta-glucosidase n=1 Tax=Amniculicola lignicola CBS 123094 TaxID=1392246 RepID=A0A6A5W5Z2_9PLEO|nr:glycoside hydrolase family 5 protein [Amniculicola lignicola CBS 123094]